MSCKLGVAGVTIFHAMGKVNIYLISTTFEVVYIIM